VGVFLKTSRWFRDPDQIQHLNSSILRGFPGYLLMLLNRFQNLIPNGKHRIETGHRFLEDHRNLIAANLSFFYLRQPGDFPAVIMDLTPGDKSRGLRHELTD